MVITSRHVLCLAAAVFISTFLNNTWAQKTFKRTTDLRFAGTVEAYPGLEDKIGLMQKAELTFEWWTLLAEPVELYHIKWYSTKQFTYNGRIINRNHG